MKSAPRRAERRVAEILSDFFISIALLPSNAYRFWAGAAPDLTINEIGMVVDVKSRLQIPIGYIRTWPTIHADLIAIPLGLLGAVLIEDLLAERPANTDGAVSVIVNRYFTHMDEWTKVHKPDGITALVLHRPKVPFGLSQLIIRYSQLPILEERCQLMKSQSTSPVKILN